MGIASSKAEVEPQTYLDLILGPGAKTSNDPYWPISVLMALSVWYALYYLLNKQNPFCSYEWNVRIVTLVHAVAITGLTGYSAFVEGPWPFTDPAGSNTALHHWTSVLALGYFLFDLSWCLYYKTEGPVMLFHHFLSIIGNSLVLWRGTNGCEMIATLFGTEVANPLLQIRWFLRHSNHRAPHSKPLAVVEFSFLTLFFVMRIVIGSYLLYTYLNHPQPDLFARCGAVVIYMIGYLFLFSLVSYALRKYTRMEEWWRKRVQERLEREAMERHEQQEEEAYRRECRERERGRSTNVNCSDIKSLRTEPAAVKPIMTTHGILDLTDKAKTKLPGSKPSYMKCDLSHDRPSLNEVMSAVPSSNQSESSQYRGRNAVENGSKSFNGLHQRSTNQGIHL